MINYNQPSRDELEVSVFGPGRGECIVLHIGNGEWFIVDSCKKDNTSNPVAYDYLKELSVDVKRQVKGILVTHWHTDHTKGLPYLVEHCKGANIWFSAALREKKVLELAKLYCSDDIGLPSIGNRIQDFADVVSYIKKNKQFNRLKSTKTRTSILKRTTSELDAHLIALSPSDASVNFALTQASKFLDKRNTSRGFYTTSEENFNSVCLHMKFNDINVILGSDLEEKEGKDDVGWSAILTDNIFTDLKLKSGQVFKVPHHGSETGHCDEAWSKLLDDKPISVLTRYSKDLPTDDDIKRIRKYSNSLYVTTMPAKQRTKRDKLSVRTMMSRVTSRKLLTGKMGHVQIRGARLEDISVSINNNAKQFGGL